MAKKQTSIFFPVLLFFILLGMLTLCLLLFLGLKPPTLFTNDHLRTAALTNSRATQLKKLDFVGLLVNESAPKPFIFGWEGDVLFYKDGSNTHWEYSPLNQKKSKAFPPRELLLKQPTLNCQNTPDDLKSLKPSSFSPEQLCQRYEQGSTVIENWPLHQITVLNFFNLSSITLNEQRAIKDIAISESGKYAAVLATEQCQDCSFVAQDVFVIEKK